MAFERCLHHYIKSEGGHRITDNLPKPSSLYYLLLLHIAFDILYSNVFLSEIILLDNLLYEQYRQICLSK